MGREYKNIAIIGAGASGCICAYFLLKAGLDVTLFDYGLPLRTLLPTGGGRCNLAHAEYDFKELAKNYPRGEKFLYSVFSKFSTYDTISLFNELGIETYTQDDGRIFPVSNSAKDVRETILNKIKKANFVKEKVLKIIPDINDYKLVTDKAEYLFTDIVISTGGGGKCIWMESHTDKFKSQQRGNDNNRDIYLNSIEGLNHNIIPFTPALVGLNANVKKLSGIVVKNVLSNDFKIADDLLFTHFGISGPLTYRISSIKTKDSYPYELSFDLAPELNDLQEFLNLSPHKEIKNIISKYIPEKLAKYILGDLSEIKAHKIDGKTRDAICDMLHNFKLKIYGTNKGEETVTAGGYDLNEINSKTMESKIYPHIYFTGEVLDIDGFCGGFNLQNAWSTAFVASESIINS